MAKISYFEKFFNEKEIHIAALQEVNNENLSFTDHSMKCVTNVGPAKLGTAIVYRDSLNCYNTIKEDDGHSDIQFRTSRRFQLGYTGERCDTRQKG